MGWLLLVYIQPWGRPTQFPHTNDIAGNLFAAICNGSPNTRGKFLTRKCCRIVYKIVLHLNNTISGLNSQDLLQKAIQRKLRLFGHIYRMEDNRKLKTVMLGIVDGSNKRGRPCREWIYDIVSWCKTGLQELNSSAQDRRRWKLETSNGHQRALVHSHGSWRRRNSRTVKGMTGPETFY